MILPRNKQSSMLDSLDCIIGQGCFNVSREPCRELYHMTRVHGFQVTTSVAVLQEEKMKTLLRFVNFVSDARVDFFGK